MQKDKNQDEQEPADGCHNVLQIENLTRSMEACEQTHEHNFDCFDRHEHNQQHQEAHCLRLLQKPPHSLGSHIEDRNERTADYYRCRKCHDDAAEELSVLAPFMIDRHKTL